MSRCFFCDSTQAKRSDLPRVIFNGKEFTYRQCGNCHLVYIDPPLDAGDLQELYTLDYHNEFYFNADRKYPAQAMLLKKFKPTGRILDYGCGDASFLRYFQNKGYELYGAEYNPALVQKLQAAIPGISFTTISALSEDKEQTFDIIHLGDVLEHLLNPKEVIELLRQKLTPGGIFFVEGPIEHNFHLAYVLLASYFKARKLLQPQRKVAMRPFHVLFANAKNQKAFFERLGLTTCYFEVFEWAWPFPAEWKHAKTIKQKAEFLAAKVSVASSKVFRKWGNRFYYIGRSQKTI